MRNALCPKIVIDALCLMTTISRRHSRHRRHLQHRRRRSCCRQDHRRLPELIIPQTKPTQKIESVTFPCLNQTGEGSRFRFFCPPRGDGKRLEAAVYLSVFPAYTFTSEI